MSIATKPVWGPLEMDSETGLPVVPENYAWRVGKADSTQSVKVSLVIRSGGLWDSVDPNNYMFTAPNMTAIGDAAKIIRARYIQSLENQQQVDSVVGIYETNR